MKIVDCIQGSPEWVKARLGHATASHFSDVLNKKIGRRTYMFRLLGERLSGEPQESYSNKAMENGIETEPQARTYYEALYGHVEQVGFIELSDYVGCSPDGLIGNDGLIEIKCPYASTHLSYIDKDVFPTVYKAQVQGNLWITDRQWCDFISYNPTIKGRPFWKIRVCRDEEYIKELKINIVMFVTEMKELEEKIINKMNF